LVHYPAGGVYHPREGFTTLHEKFNALGKGSLPYKYLPPSGKVHYAAVYQSGRIPHSAGVYHSWEGFTTRARGVYHSQEDFTTLQEEFTTLRSSSLHCRS